MTPQPFSGALHVGTAAPSAVAVSPARPMQLVTDHTQSSKLGGHPGNLPPGGLVLTYPAVEQLPEFLRTIPNEQLLPGCRAFNLSICQAPDGRILGAYRLEHWNGMNTIAVAEMDSLGFSVIRNHPITFPADGNKGAHWEDPRLAVVGGQLLLICAWVVFGAPTICRQRLFMLDPDLHVAGEIVLPYGRAMEGHPEKNWMPFETPEGGLAIVYAQRPWQVIEHPSKAGIEGPGLTGWRMPGKYLSGRTPPLKLPGGRMYLAFFGGHVRHDYRGARYFMGALVFSADRPYGLVMATPEPLAWGTECSPTLLSSRPASGHPCCLYPAGAILQGEEVVVSCGVNDSYNALLTYRLTELLGKMSPVNASGGFA